MQLSKEKKYRRNRTQAPLTFSWHNKRQRGTIFHTTAHQVLPASKLTTRLDITQDNPKRLKKTLHKAQATAQWRKRWSTDSLFLLHTQHLSITMTCRFLKLSLVSIFPRTADQAKKTNLKGALVHQILFQEKGESSIQIMSL
jgi:hypothetical protein